MKTRIKLPAVTATLETRDDAETVMNGLANIANNQRRLLAARDAEILAINKRYEAGLAQCSDELKRATELLRSWAEANPGQFPKDRKSLVMTSGTIGFRTGTPKLSPLSRAWTWDKILTNLKTTGLLGWIRTKEEVAKDYILSEHSAAPDKPTIERTLAISGMKVTQDETFFAEPDLSVFEPRQTA